MQLKQFKVAFTLAMVLLTSAFSLNAADSTQKAMVQDLKSIKQRFAVRYAPAELKKELFGWDLNRVFEDAKQQIVNSNGPLTPKSYQKMLQSLFLSAQDYHTRCMFYSTELACFPLKIKGANGRYFVDKTLFLSIDMVDAFFLDVRLSDLDDATKTAIDTIQEGDEIIAINGTLIADLIENIIDDELGGDRTPTGYAIAQEIVFARRAKYGQAVPSGSFQLTVKQQGSYFTSTFYPSWITISEMIKNISPSSAMVSPLAMVADALVSLKQPASIKDLSIFKKDYSVAFAKELKSFDKAIAARGQSQDDDEEDEDFRQKSFLPQLGTVLWETELDNEIYAYLYRHPSGKRIGYLCLATFSNDEITMGEIIAIIKKFNRESDALVVDITDNTGGYLFYMYAVLSTLTDKPMTTPLSKEILIQEDVYEAALYKRFMDEPFEDEESAREAFMGYPADESTRQDTIAFMDHTIAAWESGQRMTDPFYTFISQIRPHPDAHYSKPILVLANEMCFSCADLFPAILQDNGRAVIFGKKTAGAGGYVKGYQHASQFGVAGFNLTGSLVYRADGTAIESSGVQPNVAYDLTAKDLQDNYSDYVKAVNAAVKQLIK